MRPLSRQRAAPLRPRSPRGAFLRLAIPAAAAASAASAYAPPLPRRRIDRRPSSSASSLRADQSGGGPGEAFDFSSRVGWDDFYVGRRTTVGSGDGDGNSDGDGEGDGGSANQSDHGVDRAIRSSFDPYEWHASVPHASVLSALLPETAAAPVLVVGCGTSALPIDLYDGLGGRSAVVCLDYSAECIDQLRDRFGDDPRRDRLAFVCGDATRLVNERERLLLPTGGEETFGAIVDKGLLDALMTGEGWDGDAERLFAGASSLLGLGGTYLLVSYRLSSATKEFLVEVGERTGLRWTFDLEDGSNERISFSKGVRVG